jgi:hydroxyethylthiazole kinase-like uncharacterized protein yjeF
MASIRTKTNLLIKAIRMSESSVKKLDAKYCAGLIPSLSNDVNKYSRGTVGVVGGSSAYPGAAILASMAASRCGAGYVRLVTSRDAATCAHAHLLSIPVTGCEQAEAGTLCKASLDQAFEALAKSTTILAGPGLGTTGEAEEFLKGLMVFCEQQKRPLVLDADAITLSCGFPELVQACPVTILTPHDGEAARLLGREIKNRREDICTLANMYTSIIVLKGHQTLVASPAGEVRLIEEGGPELAKAGSGDVLAGMISAYLAQGLEAIDAASLAVFIHGRAGKHAARELSVHAVMPEDIISAIGPALLNLEA